MKLEKWQGVVGQLVIDNDKAIIASEALLSRLWTGFFDTARCRYTEKFSKPRFQPKMA